MPEWYIQGIDHMTVFCVFSNWNSHQTWNTSSQSSFIIGGKNVPPELCSRDYLRIYGVAIQIPQSYHLFGFDGYRSVVRIFTDWDRKCDANNNKCTEYWRQSQSSRYSRTGCMFDCVQCCNTCKNEQKQLTANFVSTDFLNRFSRVTVSLTAFMSWLYKMNYYSII